MMSPGFEGGQDVVDHLVDGVAGLDHEHDAAGALEQAGKLFDGVRADDLGALGFVGDEVIDLGDGAVEDGDLESVVVHVEDEVLSHDGKADEADITHWIWHTLLQKRNFITANGGTILIIQGWSDQLGLGLGE